MDFLASIAPWLSAAVGGPPALLTMAANEISKALGFTVDSKPAAITEAVSSASAEQLLAIKTAEQSFELKMKELGYNQVKDLESLAIDNQKSAREAMTQGGVTKELLLLSVLILMATIGSAVYILLYGVPTVTDPTVSARTLGFLENITMLVLGYWYGTSHGSLMKNSLFSNK